MYRSALAVEEALQQGASEEKAIILAKFFKTRPGEYGAGDQFLGVVVPWQRKVAKQAKNLSFSEISRLLLSRYHEHRLTALLILVDQFEKGSVSEREAIFRYYVTWLERINSWDLVDLSAPKIVGIFLFDYPEERAILDQWKESVNLWQRRVAILAMWPFIKKGQFDLFIALAEFLLTDREELIHKAIGWMLRELGKVDLMALTNFLNRHAHTMPRVMLRYAIERLDDEKRANYLKVKR